LDATSELTAFFDRFMIAGARSELTAAVAR
jgi:hypothetical protein